MDDKVLEHFLERGVTALEELAKDPVIQVETRPPVCPHCEKVNPVVRVQESESQGELAEFIIQCHCLHCNNVVYALPLQWEMAKTTNEAKMVLDERAMLRGNNS